MIASLTRSHTGPLQSDTAPLQPVEPYFLHDTTKDHSRSFIKVRSQRYGVERCMLWRKHELRKFLIRK